ncbi:MAG: SDR family NAD(P)-dependent oxidoreductase [Pirellulaceae bacterium]|jgi:short-subunit dehydrogenase|nr:SDR family NAD(P)-dependent oxidoreductase [Pirellulaceae bacterium]
MSRRDFRELRVICTGASSGIGAALCGQLAKRGARLVLNARRQDRLAELAASIEEAGGTVRYVTGDITQSQTRQAVLAEAESSWDGVDAIINCAGIGSIAPFNDSTEAVLRQVMEVNFFAPVELTRLALPILQKGCNPIIVNVGSVLGHRAVPRKSEYCASKFALHGFSDALRAELAAHDIDLLLASPSTTSSEFFDHVLGQEANSTRRRGMTPQRVAHKIIRAMAAGRHEIIISSGGKLLVWLDRLCPPLMNRLLARYG